MSRRIALSTAAFLITNCLVASAAFAGEFIVKMRPERSFALAPLKATVEVAGAKLLGAHAPGRIAKITIAAKNGSASEAQILAAILARPGVEYVVPNFKLQAYYAPVDALALKEQWAVAKVGAEKAWARAGNRGSKMVTVAVIDTGVDYKHESLKANAVNGYNFRDNNSDPMDKTGKANPGHGTHCAGIIGASGVAEGGTIGVSPEVSIMPLRFLGEDGSGDLESAIKAIDYAIDKRVQVISASWGATVPRSQAGPLIEAVKRASDAGVIFVAAAANDGKNNDRTDVFPANAQFDNTIAVSASGPNDEKPSWSNYGKSMVSLASPGLDIMSTLPNNKYGKLSGTSMATPLVAGLVAFLKAQDSSLSGAQIRALLQTTGVKASIETECNCRVDQFAATEALLAKQMWVVPAAGTFAVGATKPFSVMNANGSVRYVSSNESIATIGSDGMMKAVAVGDVTITATDAGGRTATSLPLHVATPSGDDGGDGGGDCPLGSPAVCDQICSIMPQLPFCKQ